MRESDQIYIELQRHLDKQAVGFPSTRSRSEINLLKHLFTPEEARIASLLSYRYEPLEILYDRSRHIVESPLELEKILVNLQKKGAIESKAKYGVRRYANAPLVVGMYEFQLGRLNPEFIKDFNAYTSDKKFGIEFLSTKLPQMRTIPIAKSVRRQLNVSPFDEVATLLKQAEPPFVVLECICRKKKALEGKACRVTDRAETCLAIGNMAELALMSGVGRDIPLTEAMSILDKNQKQGLVLQPSNTEKVDFICSCCGCCCGMLGVLQRLPKPLEFWASNFHAAVDRKACDGCGACTQRCQVGAVKVAPESGHAVVDLDRCIGCGLCVPACPNTAIHITPNAAEIRPPKTREALHEIIMAGKKSTLGKVQMVGRLLFDAIRTGRTDLIKYR